MPNPIRVSVPIVHPNTTLYIMVDTYAAFTQKTTIQPATGQPMVATGNGEGQRIGFWTTTVATPGIATYVVQIQFNSGGGFVNSSMVTQASFSAVTLNQVVLFSEDANDADDNDCIVTFMWFNAVTVAATANALDFQVAAIHHRRNERDMRSVAGDGGDRCPGWRACSC